MNHHQSLGHPKGPMVSEDGSFSNGVPLFNGINYDFNKISMRTFLVTFNVNI